MYHDQVLAPFKSLFGFDAVNITLGLPYLRFSTDHGVAEDKIKLDSNLFFHIKLIFLEYFKVIYTIISLI